VDYDAAARTVADETLPLLPAVLARDDDFVVNQMQHVPVLRELHLHTIFNENLNKENKEIIWRHIDSTLASVSPEVASMMKERQRKQEDDARKANPFASLLGPFMDQLNSKAEEGSEQAEAIRNLLGSGMAQQIMQIMMSAQQNGLESEETRAAVDVLRDASKDPKVRTSLKTLVAHVAPKMKTMVDAAVRSGASSDNPNMRQLSEILNAAEDHPFGRVTTTLSSPEGLEKVLDLLDVADPDKETVAAAIGLEGVEQMDDLAESMIAFVKSSGDSPGVLGMACKFLLGVMAKCGVESAVGFEQEVPATSDEGTEELRAARQSSTGDGGNPMASMNGMGDLFQAFLPMLQQQGPGAMARMSPQQQQQMEPMMTQAMQMMGDPNMMNTVMSMMASMNGGGGPQLPTSNSGR